MTSYVQVHKNAIHLKFDVDAFSVKLRDASIETNMLNKVVSQTIIMKIPFEV